jgi:O-antigen/teichoic acid export membrane protein
MSSLRSGGSGGERAGLQGGSPAMPSDGAEAQHAASPRGKPNIATHYLRYSVANVLVIVAGFVSFPILTRLLDNTQYGIIGYYDTLVMTALALIKLGAQHAIMRFYPSNGSEWDHERFCTNLFLVPIALSAGLWVLVTAGLGFSGWMDGPEDHRVRTLVVMLVPIVMVGSVMQIVLMASERSGLLMLTRVITRWTELALVVGFVVIIQQSAVSVFGGKLVAGALVLVFYGYWVRKNMRFSWKALDLKETAQALRYGLPMMANEVSWVALVAVNRIMLKGMTGDFAAVGIYTIGYSLAMHINVFMNATLYEAFTPVANRIHGTGGDAAVRALKDRILLPMTYASIGIAAMLLCVGQDLLVALSGPGKAGSGPVFVLVGISIALFPLIDISSYGLLLHKRSVALFATTIIAASANILMNVLLIPGHGVMGAAWAAAISYGVLAMARCVSCPRELLRFPSGRSIALATTCALVLIVTVKWGNPFGLDNVWWRLITSGVMFMAVYALPVWLLDPGLRTAVLALRPGARR